MTIMAMTRSRLLKLNFNALNVNVSSSRSLSTRPRFLGLIDRPLFYRRHQCNSAFVEAVDKKPEEEIVWNPCGVQMIPDSLYEQIFIDTYRTCVYPPETVEKCREHLTAHSLWDQKVKPIKPISLTLPPLQGEDINDHFRNIALQQTFKYKRLIEELVKSDLPAKPERWSFTPGWTKYTSDGAVSVPYPEEDALAFDVEVCVTEGQFPTLACAVSPSAWYSWCSTELIDASAQGRDKDRITFNDLIPIETTLGESSIPNDRLKEKIIVGHNVSYDRARIKEQYFLKGSKTRFLDTMSLHIAISGITSYQRALKLTASSGMKNFDAAQLHKLGINSGSYMEWNDQSSLNNLADVYKLYCDKELDKAPKEIFVKGTLEDVRSEFQELTKYCASDVEATKNVFAKLMPMFFERFPHPATFAGTLEMGTTYLPINSNWKRYIERSENTFNECEQEVKSILMQKADEALAYLENDAYKHDPWLWDMDWKVTKSRKKKGESGSDERSYPAWYRKLLYKKTDPDYKPGPSKISTSMQVVPKLLKLTWLGFPLHHTRKGGWGFLVRDSVETSSNQIESSGETNELDEDNIDDDGKKSEESSRSFPFEEWLKIWDKAKENLLIKSGHKTAGRETVTDVAGAELRNKSEETAEDLKDFVSGLEALSSTGLWSPEKRKKKKVGAMPGCSPDPRCAFIPLPHKDGPSNRVGNPLAKDFLSKIEEGVLASSDDNSLANKVVRLSKMISYWKNNRDRILGQMTVWFNKSGESGESSSSKDEDQFENGAIIPMVAVSGTLTRRAVEATWMTASNAYEDRIGSELKGMVQAPPSYHFVGADVDSQELWIASIIGDASFSGIHGSTALGWMTIQGSKSAGTDMHSKTASLIGIGRDQAKILNYGRIYGAGVNFAERLLCQFNKQLKSTDARTKAKTMYSMTKGERKYILNEEGRKLCESFEDLRNKMYQPMSRAEVRTLMAYHDIPSQAFMELIDKLVWDGGTESHMFNRLEEIAQQECPTTPFLGCCISRSLVPSVVQNDFMTSRVNWVVQSSAVDYLHIMLVNMRWLFEKYEIDGRFSISVHDEVRYLVKSEDRYRAALALQITNLMTRSFFAHQLGVDDLPMSVAYFSCVDIDKVLRKEVTQDCVTPSNPKGLSEGYHIPLGEGLTMDALVEMTGGSLEK